MSAMAAAFLSAMAKDGTAWRARSTNSCTDSRRDNASSDWSSSAPGSSSYGTRHGELAGQRQRLTAGCDDQ